MQGRSEDVLADSAADSQPLLNSSRRPSPRSDVP